MELEGEAATAAVAARLAPLLRPGDVVLLEGDLGAGKSTFARALIRTLAGAEIEVPSPSFTLVQRYALPGLAVTHVDLYRLREPAEVGELGLEEAWAEGALLVEWPERAAGLWPADRLVLRLEGPFADAPARRLLTVEAHGGWAARVGPLVA